MFSNIYKYLFLVGSAVTIFINYLSVSLPLNNVTTANVSDKYYTILTPAGFTFSIWGLIYTGLVVISFLIITDKFKVTRAAVGYFLLSCIVNCVWIFSWHNFQLLLCAFLLLLLVFLNYMTYTELNKSEKNSTRTLVTSWYLIYLGWTIVAAVINVTSYLQYGAGFDSFEPFVQGVLGGGVLVVAFLINTLFSQKYSNYTTLLVFVWAMWGILNAHSYNTVLAITIYVLMSLSFIVIAKIAYLKNINPTLIKK
jgi:translocator protein